MSETRSGGKPRHLNAIVVLGDQNAGKSTLIRHLSGVSRDDFVILATQGGGDVELRAIVSSVNEKDDPPEPEEWVQKLLDRAKHEDCPNVLLPLRYVSKGRNPVAERYYKALSKVADVRVIAFGSTQPRWVKHKVFRVADDDERNERARKVRRYLGWV